MTIERKRRAAKVLAKQTAKTRKRIKDGLATVDAGERMGLGPRLVARINEMCRR